VVTSIIPVAHTWPREMTCKMLAHGCKIVAHTCAVHAVSINQKMVPAATRFWPLAHLYALAMCWGVGSVAGVAPLAFKG
jgi:hypothetical protein